MIPEYLSRIWAAVAPWLGNHLWQSTLFLVTAALLTLVLRKNQARARYWLWLSASVKFLIPFSLLVSLGGHLARPRGHADMQPGLYFAMEQVSQPFTSPATPAISKAAFSTTHLNFLPLLPAMLTIVWLCGFVAVLSIWCVRWRQLSRVMREAVPLRTGREVEALRRVERAAGMRKPIELLRSRACLEPGIFGLVRPMLLWPARISERLDDTHLDAIIAHEICHVRRLDNLTAAIHMIVEAIFWFHPLVWWLGTRLVEERERACDEDVVQLGNLPNVYAESILKTCEFCVESPIACVSGITGADLKNRIVRIMTGQVVVKLDFSKKLLLSSAGLIAVAVPIVFGQIIAGQNGTGSPTGNNPPKALAFEVATIKPNNTLNNHQFIGLSPGGRLNATLTVKSLIERAYGVRDFQISGGPKWLGSAKYDIVAKSDEMEDPTKFTPVQEDAFIDRQHQRLQSLLADRFQLKFHGVKKELPVYRLVVAEGGPKLQPPKEGERHRLYTQGPGQMACFGASMSEFAAELPDLGVSRVVLDKTGLSGRYDFKLKWTPWEQADGNAAPPESSGPSLFTALQEQLGLKLKPEKGSVEILIIDNIKRPSAN